MSLACRARHPLTWPPRLPNWQEPCSCLRPCGHDDCRPASYAPLPFLVAVAPVAPVQSWGSGRRPGAKAGAA